MILKSAGMKREDFNQEYQFGMIQSQTRLQSGLAPSFEVFIFQIHRIGQFGNGA